MLKWDFILKIIFQIEKSYECIKVNSLYPNNFGVIIIFVINTTEIKQLNQFTTASFILFWLILESSIEKIYILHLYLFDLYCPR